MDAGALMTLARVRPVENEDASIRTIAQVDPAKPRISREDPIGLVLADVSASFTLQPFDIHAPTVKIERKQLAAIRLRPLIAQIDHHPAMGVTTPRAVVFRSRVSRVGPIFGNIPMPGLSKQNAKLQLYFEKAGFSIFVANNYRSEYVASVAGNAVGGFPVLTRVARQNWISAQAGYEFQEGYFKGLGFRVEGNNLNSPIYREFGTAGAETFYAKNGRQINFVMSYKL